MVTLSVAAKVTVPAPLLTVNAAIVLPAGVMVPVPTMVADKVVNVPPFDNVNPFKFSAVVPGLNAVVPKLRLLNQLPVVNVCTAVPLSVNDKLGALAAVPPVVPNTKVFTTAAVEVNPPVVPVQVKPVAVAMFNTIADAVV